MRCICWRSLLAFLFVFCNMILNLTVLAIIHERMPRSQPTLPDLAFDILPYADQALDLAEYIMIFQVLGLFILIFLHKYRFVFPKFRFHFPNKMKKLYSMNKKKRKIYCFH
jgi:hypothetical protein